MKRRIILSIGLLALLPSTSLAQTPISNNYVPSILQRADTGLQNASSGPTASNFVYMFFSWLDDVQTAIVGSIDSENRIVLQEKNLSNMTPCLHYDLLLIEARINKVNDALVEAIAQKRVGDIWTLKELASWLNNRYNSLVLGATDPNFVDEAFNWHYSFDEKTWCCIEPREETQCAEISRESCLESAGIAYKSINECGQICIRPDPAQEPSPVCPFDTNYLPPTEAGYGCDATALQAITSQEGSAFIEAEALQEFTKRTREFLEEHATMIPTGDALLEFSGRTPIALPLKAESPRKHLRISGCSEDVNDASQPMGRLPDGAARIALRSPFSFGREEVRISTLLEGVLRRLGRKREQEDSLKIPSEYPVNSTERAEAIEKEGRLTVVQKALRTALRVFFRDTNEEQAAEEVVPLLQSIDAQQRIESEFAALRTPTQQLSIAASKDTAGVRQFVTQYASFMLKSCIFRPCNVLLNRVLTIVLDDTCFPYTNGKYLENDWDPTECGSSN